MKRLNYSFNSQREDPSLQGYLKYPAIVMVKHNSETNYSKEK